MQTVGDSRSRFAAGHLQLLKQTRGAMAGPPTTAAWQLFYLLACLVPPGRAFVALVCEYVHAAAAPAAPALDGARDWAVKTWTALKHSTKSGARRQVRQGCTHPPEPLPSRCLCSFLK